MTTVRKKPTSFTVFASNRKAGLARRVAHICTVQALNREEAMSQARLTPEWVEFKRKNFNAVLFVFPGDDSKIKENMISRTGKLKPEFRYINRRGVC